MQSSSSSIRSKKGAVGAETNQDIGLSRGGNNTKIHAVVDALGNPVKLLFTGGNIFDSKVAVDLLSDLDISNSTVLADKAYGTSEIRDYISSQKTAYQIPPKSNTKNPWECDFWHYKERHVVECFFQKLKQFRHIATRYDKLSCCFQAFAYLACAMILLK